MLRVSTLFDSSGDTEIPSPATKFILTLLCCLCLCRLAQAQTRSVFGSDSPPWLLAVGKLDVPTSRYIDGRLSHFREDCSGTLLASHPGARADTVLTAWHCLEYYNDLSRPIVFTLGAGTDAAISREVYRVADGGGMHADWALLKFGRPLPAGDNPALAPHPDRADSSLPITMAGYSGDDGLGAGGTVLTYHRDCVITRQEERESESNCRAYKGASGGAVIQLSSSGQPLLAGVISRGDGDQRSIYVPISSLKGPLRLHLGPR